MYTDRKTDRQAGRQEGRETERQPDRHIDIQKCRQTGKQADTPGTQIRRQTYI